MTREEFIQMVEEIFDFLTSNYGFKKIKKMYAGIVIIVYAKDNIAIEFVFETLDVRVYCRIFKIPNTKIRNVKINGRYPYITIDVVQKALDYPPLHIERVPPEQAYDRRRQLRIFSELLNYYANILKDERHNILDGDFNTPKLMKDAMTKSEEGLIRFHQHLADNNLDIP